MSTFQEKLKKASLRMKDKITTGIERSKRFLFQDYKKHVIIASLSAGVLLAGSAIGYTYYKSNIHPIYHVYFQNEHIGVVDSPDVVDQWVKHRVEEESAKYEHVTFHVDQDQIRFETEELYKPSFDNQAALTELDQRFDLRADAVRLEIDGEFIGYVPDEETLYTLLDELKSQYVSEEYLAIMEESAGNPPEKHAKMAVASLSVDGEMNPEGLEEMTQKVQGQTVDMDVLEFDQLHMTMARVQQDIDVHETLVHPTQVMQVDQLKEILSSTKIEEQVYHVQPGDVLGMIAQNHNLTRKELLELNPDLSEDQLLQIGQEIVVMGSKSFITVETTEQVKKIEGIPYPVEHQPDENMYQGERRVQQKGVEGNKAVVYEILKVNGQEVNRQPIDEQVLKEPVEEIVLVGTKVKPSRGSGSFSWPAVGGKITSGYGQRWGKLHAGIDIAGVKDKTIKASDAGKVTTAGYHKGYGNHVIIDHGNGYKTLYGHMKEISVSVGDVVKTGEKLGVMGSTGHSTGVHLHFEIIKNGKTVNPAKYISR